MPLFERVNETYRTRKWRGPLVFAFNSGGVQVPWGFPNQYSLNANSWHRPKLPEEVPVEARWATLFCMFVGGVKENRTFMMHIDFADPRDNPSVESGAVWPEDQSGQGDFYRYYSNANERDGLGAFDAPCHNSELLLRWRLTDNSQAYSNPFGFNLWCQGYLT